MIRTLVSKLTLNNPTQQKIATNTRLKMIKQHMIIGHNENVVDYAELIGWNCVVITDCKLVYIFEAVDNNNMNVFYCGSVKQNQTNEQILNAYKTISSL